MSEVSLIDSCPVLFGKGNSVTRHRKNIESVRIDQLVNEYRYIKRHAPVRSRRGKRFFVGHNGIPSTQKTTNRDEEHYAIALWWQRQLNIDNRQIRLLDYQVPLKARQGDKGVGKIDMVGVVNEILVVVELKIGANKDAPLTALKESLRYHAILSRAENINALVAEARSQYQQKVSKEAPVIWLLADTAWWRYWSAKHDEGHAWKKEFFSLVSKVKSALEIDIECVRLEDVGLRPGGDGSPPALSKTPELFKVRG